MPGEIENHISSLGITLPKAAAPAANYVPYVQTGNQLFISGQIPMGPNGIEHQGKLGDDYSLENGQAAAKLCAINLLAQAKAALGDLDRIVRLVKFVPKLQLLTHTMIMSLPSMFNVGALILLVIHFSGTQ